MVKRKATPIPHWLNKKLKKHIHYTFYNIFLSKNHFPVNKTSYFFFYRCSQLSNQINPDLICNPYNAQEQNIS